MDSKEDHREAPVAARDLGLGKDVVAWMLEGPHEPRELSD